MAIITLLSDFGYSDHYVATMKANLLKWNDNQQIIDISHNISRSDIAHAAYVLRSVFRQFPKGTIHLVSIDTTGHPEERYVLVKLEEHYFVTADNGLLGLVSDQEASAVIDITPDEQIGSFVAVEVLCPVAYSVANGSDIATLGKSLEFFKKKIGRHQRATKKQIAGHVVRVDHFGNLITNIEKEAFDVLSKNRKYNIVFGRENTRRIHQYYGQVEPGDYFILFNSLGVLEIGINQGNASELFGLGYDTPVMVNFED